MLAPVAERATAPASHRPVLGLAVLCGALVAGQQRLNGGLKESLGDAVLAAVVSFGTGLVLIAVVVAARRSSRRALPVLRTQPRWSLLGGLGGASLVAVGAAAAPEIGVALLTVGIVGGQTIGGLLADGAGVGPGGRRALTRFRAAGAALCLLAIVLSTVGQAVHPRPLLVALVLFAGLMTAIQQALNGRLRMAVGDAAVATLVNFLVGTTALGVGLALRAALSGVHVHAWPTQWWLYLGGPLGVTFVAVAAVIVRPLGVLRFGLAVTAGQLVGALLLDATVPERGHGVALPTVVAAAVTLLAVAVSGRR